MWREGFRLRGRGADADTDASRSDVEALPGTPRTSEQSPENPDAAVQSQGGATQTQADFETAMRILHEKAAEEERLRGEEEEARAQWEEAKVRVSVVSCGVVRRRLSHAAMLK